MTEEELKQREKELKAAGYCDIATTTSECDCVWFDVRALAKSEIAGINVAEPTSAILPGGRLSQTNQEIPMTPCDKETAERLLRLGYECDGDEPVSAYEAAHWLKAEYGVELFEDIGASVSDRHTRYICLMDKEGNGHPFEVSKENYWPEVAAYVAKMVEDNSGGCKGLRESLEWLLSRWEAEIARQKKDQAKLEGMELAASQAIVTMTLLHIAELEDILYKRKNKKS